MRIRATTRLRNDHMISARGRLNWSQSDLAGNVGVPMYVVNALERLDYSQCGVSVERVKAIASVLHLSVEQVAPEVLLGKQIPSTHVQVRTIETESLLEAVATQSKRLLQMSPSEMAERQELTEMLPGILSVLKSEEREILKLRFGLDGEQPHTLKEIGHLTRRSLERVRQIEGRAIRELRRLEKTRKPLEAVA